MSFNSFGNILKLTTFGESHGSLIGGILDGMPSGITIDIEKIQNQLNRRKPGQSAITTSRNESDIVTLHSGLIDNTTTGHPIGFQFANSNIQAKDYAHIQNAYRPSHSDFTYHKKYGLRTIDGGGRSSARETANWVVGGTIASHIVPFIEVSSFVSAIGNISIVEDVQKLNLAKIEDNIVRCPDSSTAEKMIQLVSETKKNGDSVGGIITCIVKNVPIGLGEPIFNKLEATLARAMLTINACKGFEIGSGFEGTKMLGSEHNDIWLENNKTATNNSGGMQGGISNGMDIVFRVAFKPTSTIMIPQDSIDIDNNKIVLEGKGRHDPCVVPRAVPIVNALTYLVLADFYLLSKIRNANFL